MSNISNLLISKLKKLGYIDHKLQQENYLLFVMIEKPYLLRVIELLKNDKDLSFSILTDLSAVDYPDKQKRFEVIYNLLSLENNLRVVLKVCVEDGEDIDSVSSVFKAAVWYEREVWDMFGVGFKNNPDLRRILTDYGFSGHPLRKDFPLTGYNEVRYDYEKKKVVYEPVSLTQDYRSFDFVSPWEGSQYKLPGDEKAEAK
jgi:NADH-quinone oxidoreductase subunit C